MLVLPVTDLLLGHVTVFLNLLSKQPSGKQAFSLTSGVGHSLAPAAALTLEVSLWLRKVCGVPTLEELQEVNLLVRRWNLGCGIGSLSGSNSIARGENVLVSRGHSSFLCS